MVNIVYTFCCRPICKPSSSPISINNSFDMTGKSEVKHLTEYQFKCHKKPKHRSFNHNHGSSVDFHRFSRFNIALNYPVENII